MSIKVGFDYCKNEDLYTPTIWKDRVREIHKIIVDKTGAGGDFLGWLDYPERLPKEEIERIIKKANFFRENYEVLVVCGIGGSYLGPRAVIVELVVLILDQELLLKQLMAYIPMIR